MRLLFSRFGYLICIFSVMGLSISFIELGYSELQVLLFASIASMIFMLFGEFYIPLFKKWKPNLKDNFFPDASLFCVNYILLQSQLLQIFLASIAIQFAGGGLNVWPSEFPIAIQLVLALIISELGLYWFIEPVMRFLSYGDFIKFIIIQKSYIGLMQQGFIISM